MEEDKIQPQPVQTKTSKDQRNNTPIILAILLLLSFGLNIFLFFSKSEPEVKEVERVVYVEVTPEVTREEEITPTEVLTQNEKSNILQVTENSDRTIDYYLEAFDVYITLPNNWNLIEDSHEERINSDVLKEPEKGADTIPSYAIYAEDMTVEQGFYLFTEMVGLGYCEATEYCFEEVLYFESDIIEDCSIIKEEENGYVPSDEDSMLLLCPGDYKDINLPKTGESSLWKTFHIIGTDITYSVAKSEVLDQIISSIRYER